MSKLKNLLVKRTEEERDLAGKLAEAIGCNRSVIAKFKNPEKELDSFDSLIAIVKLLDEDNELELMVDYAESLDVNNKTARYMLEYLVVSRQMEAMRRLLNRMKEAKNKDSIEWASFYELLYTQLTDYRNVDYKQRLVTTTNYRTNTLEMRVMRKLLNVYSHYETEGYKNMLDIIEVIEGVLTEIKDGFIRKSYQARALEMKIYVCLTVNDNREEARKLSRELINLNVSKKYTAYAYHTIGLSYLYESYDEGIKHLNRSISIYEEVDSPTSKSDIAQVEDTKELFAAVWNKKIDYKIEMYYKLYIAYQGEKVDSVSTIHDVAFKLLIEGIQDQSLNLLMNSLIEFVKRGDKFQANLTKIALNRLGYNHDFITNLININNW